MTHIKGKNDFETINPVHKDCTQMTQVMIYYVTTVVNPSIADRSELGFPWYSIECEGPDNLQIESKMVCLHRENHRFDTQTMHCILLPLPYWESIGTALASPTFPQVPQNTAALNWSTTSDEW